MGRELISPERSRATRLTTEFPHLVLGRDLHVRDIRGKLTARSLLIRIGGDWMKTKCDCCNQLHLGWYVASEDASVIICLDCYHASLQSAECLKRYS